MSLATKVSALLAALQRADIEALPPAERQRLAQQCRHVADMAETVPPPAAGILRALHKGARAE